LSNGHYDRLKGKVPAGGDAPAALETRAAAGENLKALGRFGAVTIIA
jgi:hypothetical protein